MTSLGIVIEFCNEISDHNHSIIAIMKKSKNETGNTETKDYEAKVEGKFPDDRLYPDSEQSKTDKKKKTKTAPGSKGDKKSGKKSTSNKLTMKIKGNSVNESDHVPDYEPVPSKIRH